MALRFVTPDQTRLSLADGAWIEIRRELTAGEERKMFAMQVKGYEEGTGRVLFDAEKVGYARVVSYLLGWSLPVPVTESAINALDEPSYVEIRKAIDAHIDAMEIARTKNTAGGESKHAATSPSLAH